VTNCVLNRKVRKRAIHINFDGGDVSGIGGVELLRAADDRVHGQQEGRIKSQHWKKTPSHGCIKPRTEIFALGELCLRSGISFI
jgi:hypothetical protein